MERLRTHSALEQEVISRRNIFQSLAGGVILAPLLVFGHACEFLSARLTVLDTSRQVELRITADYGGNPMLPDESAAHAALQETLRVEHDGKTSKLSELAPLEIRKATQWDESMPASIAPPPDGQSHQLLIATWRWEPDSPEITFSVPKASVHDILLWRRLPQEETKSMLLIAGDRSIPLPMPSAGSRTILFMMGGGVLSLCAGLIFFGRRSRRA